METETALRVIPDPITMDSVPLVPSNVMEDSPIVTIPVMRVPPPDISIIVPPSPSSFKAVIIPADIVIELPTLRVSFSPPSLASPIMLNLSLPITFVVPIPTFVNVESPTKVDTPVTFKSFV